MFHTWLLCLVKIFTSLFQFSVFVFSSILGLIPNIINEIRSGPWGTPLGEDLWQTTHWNGWDYTELQLHKLVKPFLQKPFCTFQHAGTKRSSHLTLKQRDGSVIKDQNNTEHWGRYRWGCIWAVPHHPAVPVLPAWVFQCWLIGRGERASEEESVQPH